MRREGGSERESESESESEGGGAFLFRHYSGLIQALFRLM